MSNKIRGFVKRTNQICVCKCHNPGVAYRHFKPCCDISLGKEGTCEKVKSMLNTFDINGIKYQDVFYDSVTNGPCITITVDGNSTEELDYIFNCINELMPYFNERSKVGEKDDNGSFKYDHDQLIRTYHK